MAHPTIALYRPKPGFDDALLTLVRDHAPRLRALGLASEFESLILRSRDGTLMEIFEWRSAEALATAHRHPDIHAMWAQFETVCDYVRLADLVEAGDLFPHFERV